MQKDVIFLFTVAQVAKKLGVTTQYIYHKMNNSMKQELQEHIKEVARGNRTVKMITETGVNLIEESLEEVSVGNDDANIDKDIVIILQQNIEILQEQLAIKDKQIDVKDLQISKMNERLKEAQQLNQNNQVLLKDQQEIKMLESNKNFWDIFKRKK